MSNNVGVEGTLPVGYLPKYCTGYWVYCVRAVRYIPQPVSKQRTALALCCPPVPTVVSSPERRGVRSSLLLLPCPVSLSLSPLLLTLPKPAPTLFAHTTQVLHILTTPNLLYPHFCWPRFSTQPPPLFFPPFFSTLIGLDSVILSSSMLFFHTRDHDLSHGRATTHLCLLEHPPLT
jgi:hypothetical protein